MAATKKNQGSGTKVRRGRWLSSGNQLSLPFLLPAPNLRSTFCSTRNVTPRHKTCQWLSTHSSRSHTRVEALQGPMRSGSTVNLTWPNLPSLFLTRPAPLLVIKWNLHLYQGLCICGTFCLESYFPRSPHGLLFDFLPVSVRCYLVTGLSPDYPIHSAHRHLHSLFPWPSLIFSIELTIIWNDSIF